MRNAPANSVARPQPANLTPPGWCPTPCDDQGFQPAGVAGLFVVGVPQATRIYGTDESASLTASASAEQIVEFDRPGWVVAVSAAVTRIGSAPTYAEAAGSVALSVLMGLADQIPLVTDGESRVFGSMAALFGTEVSRVMPTMRRVRAKDKWVVQFVDRAAFGARAQCFFHIQEDPAKPSR